MRILLWYWGRRGGGAQFSLGLARELAGRPGIGLSLSVSAQGELVEGFRALGAPIDMVETYRGLGGFATGLLRVPGLARRLVEQARGADLVLSGMTHTWTPLVAPALAKAGIPFIPVVHDAAPHPGDPAFAWGWRLRRELGAARAAVALSDAVAATLARVAPGLPVVRMALPALVQGGVAMPRPAGAGLRLLFFGRLRAYKGLDLLRDAFRAFHATHPEATLRVVGEGDAESCAPGLSALPGVTVEHRWVAEDAIAALLAEADAVVLPYREASQSGIAPQALALGVPVVATPVGGLAEQVREGHGGVLATAVTAAAFADALRHLAEPGALARLGAEARAAGGPDWAAEVDRLLAGIRPALSAG
ncbi:glycosyltransferase family 4 protein [Falsiroseomonas stagni]|uniref:Glycosyltransferase involved in cell wall bisynthesis n=1 Tax=Falsiroseomonas stagni DSM 19981 TaxID=1123062 RepID=A0A1I3XKH0_9PROT|nr:glycosyltransferase family 4 protein [Falsiroseomonas stagni]SFK19546.1 Glycosyltransferase involved in cell wall bisynthesis [Falsiroseomonas stagni DSM 19981]